MPRGGNNKGIPRSKETIDKIRASLKGRRVSFPTVKSCGKAHTICKICRPDIVWKGSKPSTPFENLGSDHQKGRLISEGVPHVCALCGIEPFWNGQPLVFHLDHEDGDRSNNDRSNLRLLCPNCHSQTPTYGWKNARLKLAATQGLEP